MGDIQGEEDDQAEGSIDIAATKGAEAEGGRKRGGQGERTKRKKIKKHTIWTNVSFQKIPTTHHPIRSLTATCHYTLQLHFCSPHALLSTNNHDSKLNNSCTTPKVGNVINGSLTSPKLPYHNSPLALHLDLAKWQANAARVLRLMLCTHETLPNHIKKHPACYLTWLDGCMCICGCLATF